jgi:hypothetical protein
MAGIVAGSDLMYLQRLQTPQKKEEETMSIFERKELPLSAAPLYYQALAELVGKHWPRLWRRLDEEEGEAKAYLNLFRGEVSAFQQTVVAHIDQQARAQGSTAKKNQRAKEASAWIGLIRRAAGVAVRSIPDALEQRQLKSVVRVGRKFSKNSPGAVLLETRYLSAVLPELAKFEGLDEKFAPAEKPSAEPVSTDPNAPGAKK